MGRMDARVVHRFTASRIQLSSDSIRQEPPPALGSQAPRGSRLAVRVMEEEPMHATPMTSSELNLSWELPTRGRVGMLALIAAEAAIFVIFIVAYLFYVGKSLTGPMPKDVLRAPVFITVCLL